MTKNIINLINKKYNNTSESLDLSLIKQLCKLYGNSNDSLTDTSIELDETLISTPTFSKTKIKHNKSNDPTMEMLSNPEFKKKYEYVIRVIYVCLKLDVDIIDCDENIYLLRNLHGFIKALETKKKKCLDEHQEIIIKQRKKPAEIISNEYYEYVANYIIIIRIIDKILMNINMLLENKICKKNDNIISIILPYFYVYKKYVAEYN